MKLDEMSKSELLELGKSLNLKVDGRMKESSIIEAIMESESDSISIVFDGDNLRAMDKDELVTLGKSLGVKVDKRMKENSIIDAIVAEYPDDVDILFKTDEVSMVSPNIATLEIEIPDEVIQMEQIISKIVSSMGVPNELLGEHLKTEVDAEVLSKVVENALRDNENASDALGDELRSLTEDDIKSVDVESNEPEDENIELALDDVPVEVSKVTRPIVKPIDLKKYTYGVRGKDSKIIVNLDREVCDILYKYGIKDVVGESIQYNVAPLLLQFAVSLEALWKKQGYLLVRSNWNSWWIEFDKRGNRV